jgi:nucleoside phosphorylase
LAVSASDDTTLKVWDLGSGQLVRTLEGHTDVVNGVAMTADGRWAVSVSYDTTLKVWDLGSGQLVRTLEGHTYPVNGVAVTTDGRWAVSASEDRTLRIWDLTSGLVVAMMETSAPLRCCAVASDRLILAGDEAGALHILDWLPPGHPITPPLPSRPALRRPPQPQPTTPTHPHPMLPPFIIEQIRQREEKDRERREREGNQPRLEIPIDRHPPRRPTALEDDDPNRSVVMTDPRLEDLRAAYQTGNLVVYAGAGISAAAGLPTWPRLAADLRDRLAKEHASPAVLAEIDDLLGRSRLVDALSAVKAALGPTEFNLAIEKACDDQGRPVPEAAEAVAALSSKLRAVITTNLDRFLERAFKGAWDMLPRATEDIASRRRYILKIHGTIVQRDTWVFSRDQHDRALFASPAMRGAFEALFRTCPILFVGCGLADGDLDHTFASVRALSGDQPSVHYALVPAGVPPFRRQRLEAAGLRLIEYDNADGTHAELPRILRTIAGVAAAMVAQALLANHASPPAVVSAPAPAPPRVTAPRRAVVLTALRLEFRAVREHLADIRETTHAVGSVYDVGRLASPNGDWEVAVVEAGPGNVSASLETERAIDHFKPEAVVFVGVAGGLKDVKLGDVVAATKVYGYESGKETAEGFRARPELGQGGFALVQRARAEARGAEWTARVKGEPPPADVEAQVGPIAAGEKVVASAASALTTFLRASYGDALAVEMEGHGVMRAAHQRHVNALVVRGISDLVDGKAASDAAGWQPRAARHAAAFAMAVLAKL